MINRNFRGDSYPMKKIGRQRKGPWAEENQPLAMTEASTTAAATRLEDERPELQVITFARAGTKFCAEDRPSRVARFGRSLFHNFFGD